MPSSQTNQSLFAAPLLSCHQLPIIPNVYSLTDSHNPLTPTFKITDQLIRECSVQKFVGPDPSLGVSKQNVKLKIKCWVENQHFSMWCGPSSTHRQTRKLISGPSATSKTRLLSFNRTRPGFLLTFLLDIIPGEDILT